MDSEYERLTKELSKLLTGKSYSASSLMQYMITITDIDELKEFMCAMLDSNDLENRKFYEDFIDKWTRERNMPNTCVVYKKPELIEETGLQKRNKSKSPKINSVAEKQNNGQSTVETAAEHASINKSGKMKYVSLMSKEGVDRTVVQLPGRNWCDCQATKHPLINNCLNCGKIVCQQEGSGPCLHCKSLVCTNEEQEILNRNNKDSRSLLKKLMGSKEVDLNAVSRKDYSNEAAVEHKNKLLEFDRTAERRTKVIDDQSDYYTLENQWLNKEEKEIILERERARAKNPRRSNKFTFDFAGRQVIAEDDAKARLDHLNDEEMEALLKQVQDKHTGYELDFEGSTITRPIYQCILPSDDVKRSPPVRRKRDENVERRSLQNLRLQGSELQEMSDEGLCLSLHQPYASLIISGLKLHEGRSWYTHVRGRLWIASTAREPHKREIESVEQTIKAFRDDDKIAFPSYPVGALLGCVDLEDCIPQEEYRLRFPEGESDSPYVFICTNPQELVLKFPIKGQHKIYNLDPKIHETAKKMLKKLS